MDENEKTKKEKRILRRQKHKSDFLEVDVCLNNRDNRNNKPIEIVDKEESDVEVCFICCKKVDCWLNCKAGGLFTKNRRKFHSSNNPICAHCVDIIKHNSDREKRNCPLCRSKNWTKILDVRYPKQKPSWAERQIIIKKKKQRNTEELRRERSFKRWIRKGRFGTCPWYVSDYDNTCKHCGDDKEYHPVWLRFSNF